MAKKTSKKTASQQARKTASSSPYPARLSRLRKLLKSAEIEGLLVTNPVDINYLTGFHGEDSFLVVGPRRATIVSDFRFQEELQAITAAKTYIRQGIGMFDACAQTANDYSIAKLGIQAEFMSVAARKAIGKAFGSRKIADTVGLVRELRIVKDEAEVKLITKAARIQEQALEKVIGQAVPGVREDHFRDMLEAEIKALGGDGPSFHTIVAARANGSLPHARPGKTKIANNKPLLIDWGARYQGYCSDMTRTFHLGKWSKKMAEIYDITLEAQLAGIAACKPGVTCGQADEAARKVIRDAGYGEQFGHSLGHGIGLDIHEDPRLAGSVDTVLKPGMVVTVEPGIYLPGIGGVRIEDDILITEKGHKNLSKMTKHRDAMTLH